MKKKLLVVSLFGLLITPVLATEKTTVVCHYFTAGTDIRIDLKPMTLYSNGNIKTDGKKTGKIIESNEDEIFAALDKGAIFTIDKKKMLSTFSVLVEDKYVDSFGTCEVKN